VIDWFEDFVIPNDLMSNEYKISIKDRFIHSDLKYLDQRSANEGFLFLLFYIVLFSSKKTPQFFAIDNIEASFNPKLCSKLINMLVELSKQNNKQVLMTTHNPATLDGLDLNDPEQRLFVVRRNIDGHTIATRIFEKPKIATPMKLSEMWTKGLLGGLPDNF
jgi:AAA15 family ATPase/GTPase